MIAFLHTSPTLIERFNEILETIKFQTEVKHYLNEEILKNALQKGNTDSAGFKTEIEKIQLDQPALIICSCSTYGVESDKYKGVERIDRPIAEYLVKTYTTIGLAYAASSTKEASKDLLFASADKANKTIEVIDCDCTKSWKHLEVGDKESYLKEIAKEVTAIDSKVEAIFLAQASMENAKSYLQNISIEVVSSPEYGIQKLLKPYR